MKFIKLKKNNNVLPESFVSLPPKKQTKLAHEIAGDCSHFSEVLLLLWRNGIDTKYASAGDYNDLTIPKIIIKRDGILKIYSVLDEFLKGVTQDMNGLCHLEIDKNNQCYIISAHKRGFCDSKESFERGKWEYFSRLRVVLNEIFSNNKGIETRFRTEKPLNDQIFDTYCNKMLTDKDALRQMRLSESDIFSAISSDDYFSICSYIFDYIEQKHLSSQQEAEKQR